MTEKKSPEERLLEAVNEEEEEEFYDNLFGGKEQHQRLQQNNRVAINRFLGKGGRAFTTGILPRYYGELLTWALHQYLEREGWKISGTLGNRVPEPVYTDVNTGDETCNLLMDGQLLIEKGNDRYIVTVDNNPRFRGSVQVKGPAGKKEDMAQLIAGIITIAKEENFYRGRKIEFSDRIRFLNVQDKIWDSIVLETETKTDIKANTVGFLEQSERWSQFGIPPKRGILLAGEPGTGKTVICKALMAEADGVTCINTNSYTLVYDEYIDELYELAQDLSPSIIFIEDLDLIGQDRMEYGYQRGPAMLSLLSAMDGIEEMKEIVTVATTNCLETLDKALSQRPSRFDRVIKLSRPGIEQRRELVRLSCRKIPLSEALQEYVAYKTDDFTPAQIQEIVYSLVIQCPVEQYELAFNEADVDQVISRINNKNGHRIGFLFSPNHNGKKPDHAGLI